MSAKDCILAYSGGLDTSAIVPWLLDQGYNVHALLVDVGQDEDFATLRERALQLGATQAVVRDAKPQMAQAVIPLATGLAARFEGQYRLGTALARPFIAQEQVRLAQQLGGAALAHGATGKGNDQIRFEHAYRSLAPECEVIAPWKLWNYTGRADLIDFLHKKGCSIEFEAKTYSLDENLWHLSVEGGALENPEADLDVDSVLEAVSHRFARHGKPSRMIEETLELEFLEGVPVKCNGMAIDILGLIAELNHLHRDAPWAWDLVLENRFTGIKSRGIYINPAACLLQTAADELARSCFNKPTYDLYSKLGVEYANMLYRGEYFSQQRLILEATAGAVLRQMNGVVTLRLDPVPYVSRLQVPQSLFQQSAATFEASDFSHQDAAGFIHLSWLSSVGAPFKLEHDHESTLEANIRTASSL